MGVISSSLLNGGAPRLRKAQPHVPPLPHTAQPVWVPRTSLMLPLMCTHNKHKHLGAKRCSACTLPWKWSKQEPCSELLWTWLQFPAAPEAQFNGFGLVLLDPINDKDDKHICFAFIAISRFDMILGNLPMLSA